MASKKITPPLFISFIIYLLTLLPLLSHADEHQPSKIISLMELRGARKGVKLQGLHQLKKYLNKFGYLTSLTTDNDFDDKLEVALKTYQKNFRLKPTGSLDVETLSMMMMPRCGVPDILDDNTIMQGGHNHSHIHGSNFLNVTVSLYALQGSKWKSMPVKYRFTTKMSSSFQSVIKKAMSTWSAATNGELSFEEVSSSEDISIGFFSGDHGDGIPFDGPAAQGGYVLAHSFFPQYGGDLHFDATEKWSVDNTSPTADYVDVETVALHELGHTLGLLHSDVPGAVMGPYYTGGRLTKLTSDDIQGIRYLYGS